MNIYPVGPFLPPMTQTFQSAQPYSPYVLVVRLASWNVWKNVERSREEEDDDGWWRGSDGEMMRDGVREDNYYELVRNKRQSSNPEIARLSCSYTSFSPERWAVGLYRLTVVGRLSAISAARRVPCHSFNAESRAAHLCSWFFAKLSRVFAND